MNKIIFAGKYESFKTSKNFEIIAPDGAENITVEIGRASCRERV